MFKINCNNSASIINIIHLYLVRLYSQGLVFDKDEPEYSTTIASIDTDRMKSTHTKCLKTNLSPVTQKYDIDITIKLHDDGTKSI